MNKGTQYILVKIVTVSETQLVKELSSSTQQFIQEGTIEDYIKDIPELYHISSQLYGYTKDNVYEMIGHSTMVYDQVMFITVTELKNNQCRLSDIYSCEDGYFKLITKEPLTETNPIVEILDEYYDFTDDDEGYDDYHVYEVKEVK